MDDTKLTKIPLDKLAELGLEDTGKVILRANEALLVNEFRRMLAREAESSAAIEEMRSVIDVLAVGHVMAIEQIQKLTRSHDTLARQHAELHERQGIISAVLDVFAQKLEEDTKARLPAAEAGGDVAAPSAQTEEVTKPD
jgi:L-aminopeptidase/D-esterase-like protein